MLYWWLVEVIYWYKVGLWPKILVIFSSQDEKENFTGGKFEAHEVRLNQLSENLRNSENLEKLKIPIKIEGTYGGHLGSVTMLLAILDVSHYQKSQTLLPWLHN